jgi:hypothetical protein
MSKRRDARANRRIPPRKISHFYYKEEFDLDNSSPLPPKRSVSMQWLVPVLPIAIFCTSVALAVAFTIQDTQQDGPSLETLKTEAFRWAVNRAMSAAELTQTADSRNEWSMVSAWWQEAIDLMGSVPQSHPKYQLAQQKVGEYQQNLAYAQTRIASKPEESASAHLWAVGSRRVDVLRVQGEPTHTTRYDALCQEVMYYGSSSVELSNGIVAQYEDLDKNLKVAAKNTELATPHNSSVWTLGSSKEEVFRVQGTPNRVARYDSLQKETLYYNYNTIELTEDQVTGYHNLDGSLRVSIAPIMAASSSAGEFWSIGSDRNNVFQVQGTPSQVTLEHSLCRETLHYGESTIELKNGFVAGYDNLSGNLRVKVQ